MTRLQELEDELLILRNHIKELHNRYNKLSNERIKIIRSNCEHKFEGTGYTEEDYENNVTNFEEICYKCGLKRWY